MSDEQTTLNLDNIDLSGFNNLDVPMSAEDVMRDQKKTRLNATMSQAVIQNPTQTAKVRDLSRRSGIPAQAVESDIPSVETHLKLKNINLDDMVRTHPVTSDYLSQYDNAAVAHDDIDTLKNLESLMNPPATTQPEYLPFNTLRGLGGRITGLLGSLASGISQASDSIEENFPTGAFTIVGGIPMYIPPEQWSTLRKAGVGKDAVAAVGDELKSQDFGYIPRSTWDSTKEAFSNDGIFSGIAEALSFGVESGVVSLADMAATVYALPAYIFARSEEMGQARAKNKGMEKGTIRETLEAAPFAVGSAILERILPEKVLGGMSKTEIEKVGKAILEGATSKVKEVLNRATNGLIIEASTEAVQEGIIEYLGEKYGTDSNIVMAEMIDRALGGAVGGGIAGGAIAGGVETVNVNRSSVEAFFNEYAIRKLDAAQKEEMRLHLKGIQEQKSIDGINEYSANSELRKIDPDSFRQFIDQSDGDKDLSIFVDGVQAKLYVSQLPESNDPVVQMLNARVSEAAALGSDVAIPIADFATMMAGTEHYNALREFMTLSGETTAPFRQEQRTTEFDNYVQSLMAEAEENTSSYVEAQDIYNSVREQLIDTGIVSGQNAAVMAQLVPAWATVFAQRNGITIKEAYEQSGLLIQGPQTGEAARLAADAEQLTQMENQQAVAKGLDMSQEARMQRAKDMGFDTDRVVYHGTSTDFTQFDPDKAIGTQFWSTTNLAEIEAGEVGAQGKGVIKELYARVNNPASWKEYDNLGIDELIGRGYDGVKLDDKKGGYTLIAFNPNQYRSVNAAFDPEFKASPELLAQRDVAPEGLDMSQEARMQRAKDMGFDTDNVWYHGTDAEFKSFDRERLGTNTMGNASDPAYGATSFVGFWFNDGSIIDAGNSPYTRYTENLIKSDNPLEFDSLEELADELRGIIPSEYDDTDEVRKAVDEWVSSKAAEGYDSVQIDDEEFGGKSVVVFHPSQIRSVNAAFAPEFKASPELLAQRDVAPSNDLLNEPNQSEMIGGEKVLVDEPNLKVMESEYRTATSRAIRYVHYEGGRAVGVIQITTKGGRSKKATIANVYVEPEFRRQKIAANLLKRARQDFEVKHSDDLTNDGRAFSKADGKYYQTVDPATKEFDKWFGDSIVVDKTTGEPLIVYHGTGAEVDGSFVFDYSKIGTQGRAEGAGFYFTPNKGIADGYGSGATLSVFLSIQNPIDYNQKGFKGAKLKKLLKRIAEMESAKDEMDIEDGFLSNYGDARYEGLNRVIASAASLLEGDTALDQLSGLVGSGVDIETINRATQEVTGHDGIVSDGFSGMGGDKIYVAFFPEQIKSVDNTGTFDPANPDIYAQNQGVTRGYYSPSESIIRLNEAANLSTFLHEFAHFMYEMELTSAKQTPDSVNMISSIHNWYKRNADEVAKEAMTYAEVPVTSDDVVMFLDSNTTGDEAKDNAIWRAVHEQFARGFETYLMEGKAPSIELRNAFRTFARWLTQVYRAVRGNLRVNLDPEMRKVFDTLLATEEQINAAEARANYAPMFTDAAMAGMTEQEFAEYKQKQDKVKDKQTETLRDKLIAEITRQSTKWWKEELADEVDVQTEALKTERVYRAREALKEGEIKLDHAATKDLIGEDIVNSLGRKQRRVPPKLKDMTIKGAQGVHPDEAAALLGYGSGDEMLADLMDAPTIEERAEAQAEAVMLERHGDILHDGTIEKQADDALLNEERGALILTELRALGKGTKAPAIDRQMLKSMAEESIGKLAYRNIHPEKYRKAEIRAAQESAAALQAGNKEGAMSAKVRQAMNFYLNKAATEARNDTMKIVERMARYNTKTVREAVQKAENGYWEQIVKILNRFEFRKSASLRGVDQRNQDINSWVKERVEIDGDALILTPEVLDELFTTHWKNVEYDKLKGINDSVKNIEHVARYANKIKTMGEEIEFKKLVNRWTTHMDAATTTRFKSQRTDVAEGRSWGRMAMAQMTKIPFLASWLDGGERGGMSHDILVQPFTDAQAEEVKLWTDVGQPVMELIEGRSKADIKRHNTKVFIRELVDENNDGNLYGNQIVAVALNTGNAGNLRKMLLGEGWANAEDESSISLDNPKLQAILRRMTKSDWDLVQTIWDRMELLYPQLSEVHRRTTGLVPPKVDATPVQTPYGEYKGGYYPVKYDPNRSQRAQDNEDKLNAQVDSMFSNSASIQASVTASATSERTKYYAPIRLSLDVVPAHFQETIHFITHHDAVRQANKLIRNPEVTKTIKEKLGPEEYAQLKPWLNDIAKDGREANTKLWWEDMIGRLRFGITLGSMGFKASTGIMQLLGVSNIAAEVGAKYAYQSFREILGSPANMKNAWDFASSNSKILNNRVNNMDREIKNAMSRINSQINIKSGSKVKDIFYRFDNSNVLKTVQEASMKHIAYIQTYMVDLPTWYAAYIKELEASGDEAKAYRVADTTVEMIQGSGATKDLAAIMRTRNETTRMLTMFMTFFSSLWNMNRDLVKGAKSGQYSVTTVAAKLMFLTVVPVAAEMLLRGELDSDDEDEDTRLQKFLTKTALYPVASLPFVRDIASGTVGEFGYNMSPVASLVEQGTNSIPELIARPFTDEEITKGQVKGGSKFVAAALGIPATGQIWATGEHLYEVLEEGEELTVRELLFGPKK
jgi:GNAT superfamily N-acetyltransferase